ncbi:MAG: type 1 glutamine amidotransferase [Solirubrobacteraceae bacterium]|nr:type 1 glutamine amidotransferase [Patulibacter sp.]
MRPILVLEHERDSPPALLGAWLDARGLAWEHRTLADGLPADLGAYAAVASLGSTNSVNDDEPWIAAEIGFVEQVLAAGLPVLGLCFGAQLLARAAGGTVVKSPQEEFGWVQPLGSPSLVTASPWFCWHGDAFTIPPDATLVAENAVCPQAYVIGRSAGFQFHPEVDEAVIELWMRERATRGAPLDLSLTSARFPDLLPGLQDRAFALFDWWLQDVAGLAGETAGSPPVRAGG